MAISLKGDYTVIAVADVHRDGSVYLVHLHRERMPGTKLVPSIKAVHSLYHPQVIYVEDVAFQRLVIQEARAQKLPVRGVKPEGDKISRSVMLQVALESGNFHFPKNAPFLKDLEEEMSEFPNSKHDDQVDALSYLAIEANNLYRRIPEKPREDEETEEQRRIRLYREALLEGLL